MINQKTLKEMLSYNPKTGNFLWISRPKSSVMKIETIAGGIDKKGYNVIKIFGKTYKAHRLAWLFMYGRWPNGQIDHINGIRDDNRICNLRECSQSENLGNCLKINGNKKLPRGITFKKGLRFKKRYQARIAKDKKIYQIGCFETLKEAEKAYHKKHKELFKEFSPYRNKPLSKDTLIKTLAQTRAKKKLTKIFKDEKE